MAREELVWGRIPRPEFLTAFVEFVDNHYEMDTHQRLDFADAVLIISAHLVAGALAMTIHFLLKRYRL